MHARPTSCACVTPVSRCNNSDMLLITEGMDGWTSASSLNRYLLLPSVVIYYKWHWACFSAVLLFHPVVLEHFHFKPPHSHAFVCRHFNSLFLSLSLSRIILPQIAANMSNLLLWACRSPICGPCNRTYIRLISPSQFLSLFSLIYFIISLSTLF